MRECCRQVEPEVVSKRGTKFTKPGARILVEPCTVSTLSGEDCNPILNLQDVFILRLPRERPPLCDQGPARRPGAGAVDLHGRRPAGTHFNRSNFGLNFGLKNGLRFHFDSESCLNHPFLNIFLYYGISSQNSSGFSSQN